MRKNLKIKKKKGISTCHIDPETKARIASLIVKELKLENVTVHSGDTF